MHLSPSKMKNRRYQIDRPVHVTCLDDGQSGVLPASSLIRNESRVYAGAPRGNLLKDLVKIKKSDFHMTFEASTDGGRTWYRCRTQDTYISHR